MLGISLTEDLKVVAVNADGPAARGGVRIGDLLVAVNGTQVTTKKQALALLAATKTVHILIFRPKIVNIPKREDEGLGLEIDELGPYLRITGARPDGVAAKHHEWISVHILKQINGVPVKKIAQVRELTAGQSLVMLDLLVQFELSLENEMPPQIEVEMRPIDQNAVSPSSSLIYSSATTSRPVSNPTAVTSIATSSYGPRSVSSQPVIRTSDSAQYSGVVDSSSGSIETRDVLIARAANDRRTIEKLQDELRRAISTAEGYSETLQKRDNEIAMLRKAIEDGKNRRSVIEERAAREPRDKVDLLDTIERQHNTIETQKREIAHLKAEQTATDRLLKSLEEQVQALKLEKNALVGAKAKTNGPTSEMV